MRPNEKWHTREVEQLAKAFLTMKNANETARFLRDLLTIKEIQTFAQRWQVACLLDSGKSFKEIEKISGASSATITRVNQYLHYGEDGYQTALQRIKASKKS
ncbi:MAG TPA: YerC/YecD family TrpR-related protein [bacterium]|nr:YerC/YecD family TrpR-related protein [bacterium]